MAETSCCIAASYEAKAFGIKTGTSVADARKMCPEITLIVGKHEMYVDFHHRAVAAVERIAPVRQVMSIDEMECELTSSWRGREKAERIAMQIKQELQSTVGTLHALLHRHCAQYHAGQIGFRHAKAQWLDGAGIAGHSWQNFALETLRHQRHWSAHRTPLAGRQHHHHGRFVRRAACVAQRLGWNRGREMYDKLRGKWYDPREAVTRTLGHSYVLPPDLRNAQGAWGVLNRLTQKAAMRLRKQGYYATGMRIFVRNASASMRFHTVCSGRRRFADHKTRRSFCVCWPGCGQSPQRKVCPYIRAIGNGPGVVWLGATSATYAHAVQAQHANQHP